MKERRRLSVWEVTTDARLESGQERIRSDAAGGRRQTADGRREGNEQPRQRAATTSRPGSSGGVFQGRKPNEVVHVQTTTWATVLACQDDAIFTSVMRGRSWGRRWHARSSSAVVPRAALYGGHCMHMIWMSPGLQGLLHLASLHPSRTQSSTYISPSQWLQHASDQAVATDISTSSPNQKPFDCRRNERPEIKTKHTPSNTVAALNIEQRKYPTALLARPSPSEHPINLSEGQAHRRLVACCPAMHRTD